ncbi:MAG: acyltransferase [Burkholderiaceae bacterium]|nr:acyltransferase [Microbacteriaceae bacterium]
MGRLAEDLTIAASSQLMCNIGGSKWIPRTVRRLLFAAAGAHVRSSPGIEGAFVGRPSLLTIGHAVYINREVFIEAVAPVAIGDGTAIGMQAMILTSHHAIEAGGRWSDDVTPKPVTIGERVWIGARAVILPGAVIEHDAIIAAGAVVSGRCEAFGVYAGVPARRIRDHSGAVR